MFTCGNCGCKYTLQDYERHGCVAFTPQWRTPTYTETARAMANNRAPRESPNWIMVLNMLGDVHLPMPLLEDMVHNADEIEYDNLCQYAEDWWRLYGSDNCSGRDNDPGRGYGL